MRADMAAGSQPQVLVFSRAISSRSGIVTLAVSSGSRNRGCMPGAGAPPALPLATKKKHNRALHEGVDNTLS